MLGARKLVFAAIVLVIAAACSSVDTKNGSYAPNAPMRPNLTPKRFTGNLVVQNHTSGAIKQATIDTYCMNVPPRDAVIESRKSSEDSFESDDGFFNGCFKEPSLFLTVYFSDKPKFKGTLAWMGIKPSVGNAAKEYVSFNFQDNSSGCKFDLNALLNFWAPTLRIYGC